MSTMFLSSDDKGSLDKDSRSQTDSNCRRANQRTKLLIVDDSPTVVETLKIRLEKLGYDVVAHTKSLGTMVAVLRERPDLILLDVEMPLVDGVALCTLIKQHPSMNNMATVPVVFYSSLSDIELTKLVSKSGAQGYISKSLPIDQVVTKICSYL